MKFLNIMAFLILISCSSGPNSDLAGGSSSETTSGVVMTTSIHSIYGKAQVGTKLILCESGYSAYENEGFRDSAMVSFNEKYLFENLSSGYYNLIAVDTLTGKGVFIGDIDTEEDSKTVHRSFNTPGAVTGEISTVNAESRVVSLEGTPFYSAVDESGAFEFLQIPPGTYQLQLEQINITDSGGEQVYPPYEINVLSDSTVTWKE